MLKNTKRDWKMKEFFGIGGYQRTPEGAFSWQHLLFVTSLMVLMVFLNQAMKTKQKLLLMGGLYLIMFYFILVI